MPLSVASIEVVPRGQERRDGREVQPWTRQRWSQGGDITLTELGRILRLGDALISIELTQVVDIQLNAHPSVLLPEPFARLLGVLARLLQPSLVDTQPDLLRHELRKVDGEAVGVIELPDVLAREGL
jgi:hypothetical protein